MPQTDNLPSRVSKASRLNLLKLPQGCLRPFEGDQGRKTDRFGEREIEKLPAAIRTSRDLVWHPVSIRDYSLFGFGLHWAGPARSLGLAADDFLELRIDGPWEKPITIPCRVKYAPGRGESLRIGVQRMDLSGAAAAGRLELPLDAACRIAVRIANPLLYREWCEAHLVGFGSGGAWIFESRDAGLLLFKDISLSFRFDLPMEADGLCLGSIVWAKAESEDRILFAIKWERISFSVSNAAGEHLLQTGSLKPADLAPFGIHLRRFRERLKFSVVSTLEEYGKALDLRKEAYMLAGKVPHDTTPEKLSSRFDRESRILAAYHGKEMVASLGLTFPGGESFKLKSEILFPGGKYPVPVPEKRRLIEAHSFCTRKEYRGGDLVRGVFEQVARCMLLSDREWMITLTTEALWPLYRKIGFRKTGASVPIGYLAGLEHHLILLHRSAWISGRRMTIFAWNYFYADLVRDLVAKGYIEPGWPERLAIAAKSRFGRLSRRISDARMEREFKTFLDEVQGRRAKHD